MDMGLTNNMMTSNVLQKYTNGGKSQGNVATSQHNKGWSDEGLRRFNELFELVEKNRVSPNAHAFEEEFRQGCKAKAEGRKKKKVTEQYVEAVQVRYELWSDDEEGVTTVVTGTEPSSKRIKMDNFSPFYVSSMVENDKTTESTSKLSDEDEEDTEDEAEGPPKDKPVFWGV